MDQVELVKFIRDRFNDSELRDLCFEMGIDYDSLGGEGKAAKARELVAFCVRRNRLPELERTAQQMNSAFSRGAVAPHSAPSAFNQSGQVVLGDQINVQGDYVEISKNVHTDGGSYFEGNVTNSSGRQIAVRDDKSIIVEDKSIDHVGSSLRLDVAVPEKVHLGQVFEIAACVKQKQSPILTESDLNRVQSGDLQVSWSDAQDSIRLRLEVSAATCDIQGPNYLHFQLRKGLDSPVFYFHLMPKQLGKISIVVTVFQLDDCLGSTRILTSVQRTIAGKVKVKLSVESIGLDRAQRSSLEKQLTEARENLRLIEERQTEFVERASIPLQLIKDERYWRDRIKDLETKLGG